MPPGAVGFLAADIGHGVLGASFGCENEHIGSFRFGVNRRQILGKIGIQEAQTRRHPRDEKRFGIVAAIRALHIERERVRIIEQRPVQHHRTRGQTATVTQEYYTARNKKSDQYTKYSPPCMRRYKRTVIYNIFLVGGVILNILD